MVCEQQNMKEREKIRLCQSMINAMIARDIYIYVTIYLKSTARP